MQEKENINKKNMLFLLGGHDLEMMTIRDVLKEQGIAYVDHQLDWHNAQVSSYRKEMEDAGLHGQSVWGIELQEDMPLPPFYHRINHHNECSHLPTALEQVLEILNLPMNRHLQLVAVNDKSYIPGLQNMGATLEEINAIRHADRKAQGVTDEDERLAELAIKENLRHEGDLLVVKALSSHFAPLCDRLYFYQKLLVYTDSEWMYSGQNAAYLYELLCNKGDGKNLYRGGGSNGYVGLVSGTCSKEHICNIVEQIIKLMKCPYSYHIFYFPFRWGFNQRSGESFTKQIDLKNLTVREDSYWEREHFSSLENIKDADEQKELFNELQYYFEFVHPVLYDMDQENPIIYHYERKEPRNGNVSYHIVVKDKEYVLKVDSINLNFYSTGVGVLTFFLANYETSQKDVSDILNINQFGRRIMAPHWDEFEKEKRSLLSDCITIKGLQGAESRYTDAFSKNYKANKPYWKPASFINNLINDLNAEVNISPVIDDRMLVNCWYGNDDLAKDVSEKIDNFIMEHFWYKYVFVDNGEDTCQNERMKKDLLEKSTYYRWQNYGTLYGLTRYSMVALTNTSDFAKNVLAMHMRTIYSRMFELVIVQRASILRFSGEVTNVSNLSMEKDQSELAELIDSLYKEYIRFVNQVYFTYVTAQDQGEEMYEILMRQFSSSEKVKDLDGEIGELYQYVTLKLDRQENSNSSRLNTIAVILVLPTLVAGMLGMNSLCKDHDISIIIEIVIVFLLSFILWYLRKKIPNWLDKMMK